MERPTGTLDQFLPRLPFGLRDCPASHSPWMLSDELIIVLLCVHSFFSELLIPDRAQAFRLRGLHITRHQSLLSHM